MIYRSEIICLEYSQILGALTSAKIACNLVLPQKNLFNFQRYIPLEFNFTIINKIINLKLENELILTEDLWQEIAYFNDTEMTIALFPLIVYCYKNKNKLEQELNKLFNKNQRKIYFNYIKLVEIVIFMIIENRLNRQNIFDEIHQSFASKNHFLNIAENQLLENLVMNKLTLSEVEEELINSPILSSANRGIYQALYSFLTMNYSWEISLQRSSQFSQQKKETTILTGLLLGLHHGYWNIPFSWRNRIKADQENEMSKIENLSQQLVARWQGKLDNKY
jgi:hypothetical protein